MTRRGRRQAGWLAAGALLLSLPAAGLAYTVRTCTEVSRPYVGRLSGPVAGYLADEVGFFSMHDLSRNGSLLCGQVSDLAWPERDGVPRFGQLRRLPDAQVPAGFRGAYENARYRYLFASPQEQTEFDTVIELRDGRLVRGGHPAASGAALRRIAAPHP
ncbi:hypothetical protein [Ralstonia sp. UBA689]|uniref:hypothetical protein n=1 Tax=Ralstonia sp. UBA689 TaxID=1947373 RepID=UPI0025E698DB|nr:hypothetical protein [Ralstonia sp. UBA689]